MESSYEIRNLENQNRDVGTCQIFEEKHYLLLQIKRL